MLLFQDKPDKIFTEILHGALEFAIDIVKFPEEVVRLRSPRDKDGEHYKAVFPHASKNFPRELALYVLEELLAYSKDPNLWKMTDYHFVLIYDALKHHCDLENDMAMDSGESVCSIGDYTIREIHFDDLIDCYFRDTDFLFPKEFFLDVPEEKKKHFGCSRETFGIVTGMKPHLKELALEFHEEGKFIPKNPMPTMFRKTSRVYPDVCGAEAFC